eukprot:Skav223698  [mRNA]  locus=scaffold1907:175367:179896:+ [translate_table: standard]
MGHCATVGGAPPVVSAEPKGVTAAAEEPTSAMPEPFDAQAVPAEIRCNAIIDFVLASMGSLHGGFKEFLRRSLSHRVHSSDDLQTDLWPCPPPCWRWTGSSNLSPKRRRRRKSLELRAKLLQHIVVCLNWLTLGHAKSPPPQACIGARISPQQHDMLERLESQVHYFLASPALALGELGRAGEKLASICSATIKLPSVDISDLEVTSFLTYIKEGVDPYGATHKPHGTVPSHSVFDSTATSSSEQMADLGQRVPLNVCPAKPVVADRIKWKLGPSFDPSPYLSDPVVAKAFKDPNVLRRPIAEWPAKRRAKVHCSREELVRLAEKWDALQSCQLVEASLIDPAETVGIFAVGKDEDYDRLILNPTVINSRCYGCNSFTKTLAPGHLAGLIRLRSDERLTISSDDLSEYYYTFCVSDARARRNSIGIPFWGSELSHLSCYKPHMANFRVYIALKTLAMGDALAVEIAQQSHYNLLQQLAGAMKSSEVLQYRKIIPRGPFYELLTIDDHIGLQKVPLDDSSTFIDTKRDVEVFTNANKAYDYVGLTAHPGKRRRRVHTATVLGAEIDGTVGRISAPRSRLALLMFATMIVVKKQTATRKLLQSLVGCWIHAGLFRRPIFSVMHAVFNEGSTLQSDQVFQLSAMARHELLMLVLLGPLLQVNMRAGVAPSVYMLDASPSGGAICHSPLGETACEELWRHTEQRGYYTCLQSGASSVLRELGLEHAETFGVDDVTPLPCPNLFNEDAEDIDKQRTYEFDCIELFSGQGNWSAAHAAAGLRVHPGFERSAKHIAYGDLLDDATFREIAFIADSGVIKEWHAGPPCWSFGTLRRPRLRGKTAPAGFQMRDPVTQEQTLLAVRTAFIMILAVLRGCYISVEQPGSSVMFDLHIFQVLIKLGCQVTKFPFCSFGSGFMKPSKWLHNKPWLVGLQQQCSCAYKGNHFVVQGSFTRASIRQFDKRCVPGVAAVYGRMPSPGEAVSSFSASYPKPLVEKMASGSVLAHQGLWPERNSDSGTKSASSGLREWRDDPDWIQELCEGVPFRELFRYRFKKSGHINTLECRVYKSFLKFCAKRHSSCRVVGLLDSRVTLGAAAKGRSSSKALSHILKTSLGYILGGDLYVGGLHCRSPWNRADDPSRDREVQSPTREFPGWIEDMQNGNFTRFEAMISSSQWHRPLGRWVRLLLLLCGDVEQNPGPPKYKPRGELNMNVGFSQATSQRMRFCLQAFSSWLQKEMQLSLDEVLSTAETADLALRAYGKFCFSQGRPRYWLVYAITAVQHEYPTYKNFLNGAWQVDRKWQLEEPGQCRAVLSAPLVQAIIGLGLLWNWFAFAGVVALGFSAMLHPNEFIFLQRSDLVFPSDTLEGRTAMYVRIRNPKTARFARRQHARIDDPTVILLSQKLFGALPAETRIFPGSVAVFRRQWNAVLDHLEVPRRQAQRGATPGTLRGSGATHLYLQDMDLSKIAWRGRWSRLRTLEYYIQEVGAQLFLFQLNASARQRISDLSSNIGLIVASIVL